MTRKIISALLALILCFSLVVSVSAESRTFIVDEIGYLAESELDLLNKQAQAIYENIGVGIFFVYTNVDDITTYDVSSLTGGMKDYFVMIENDEYWYTFLGGIATDYIDTAAEDALRNVYEWADTYIAGVSEFLEMAADYFPQETGTTIADAQEYFLYDEADLLNDAQEAVLEAKLASISADYNAQVIVCTIASMEGADIDRYMDYLYDTMGFGYGENHDGVLLLVCMDPREFWTLSNGYAGVAIGNSEIDAIGDAIVSDMSDGNYLSAFDEFADQCAYYLDGYINGFPFNFSKNLLISLAIGIAAGLIVAFLLKSQLKSVHKQDRANAYVKAGSMNLTHQSDIYLYRTVSRTKKSSSSSSGSGGTARSKGGRSF